MPLLRPVALQACLFSLHYWVSSIALVWVQAKWQRMFNMTYMILTTALLLVILMRCAARQMRSHFA